MPILRIITEPDPRYTPPRKLRGKAEPIAQADIDDELRALAHDMFETMLDANGVGLAGPQVGVMRRIVVIHMPAGYDDDDSEEVSLMLVNPELVKAGGRDVGWEGCLSFPDLVGEVQRYATVQVKALDVDGKPLRIKARGQLARCLQHEIDHLDGILFFDRMDDWSTLHYPEPIDEQPAVEQQRELSTTKD